ncbi:MAG: beta-propeller domain-containing protein, partial [Gammaproteobacteria bacterium]
FGDAMLRAPLWQAQETRLVTYDIGNPASPVAISELQVEGALVASRRVGDEILLITRHTPEIPGFLSYPQSSADVSANQSAVATLTAADVLPLIRRNGSTLDVLRLDACYRQDGAHPLAANAPEGATVTTLLTVSASSGAVLRAQCMLEPVSGVYVSGTSIALTWVDARTSTASTYVHLLRLRDLTYQGSERVAGQLYGGGNADFRISERLGVLRLVTTEFTADPGDRFDHRLFTLRANPTAPELDLLATLPGPADPELGKPNEDLYGVRFIDRRAYLVTFERTDPLYIIDLADPTRPTVLGELEVPGFSDLLHPVSDDLLLGIGRSEQNRLKAELYNIENPAAPLRAGLVELGSDYDGSYSPAQYNRHAFTYLSGSTIDRFTLPYTAWRTVNLEYQSKDAIALFEVAGKDTPEAASLVVSGEVKLPGRDAVSDQTRVVIDADALYAWTGQSLLAGFWSNPENVSTVGP